MSNLFNLIKGELIRLYKYKIIVFSIIVALIWVFIIGVANSNDAKTLVPMLLVMDAALMSIILLAASFYLEKQEGTIKTLLVAPVKLNELLLAKVIAAVVTSLISTILIVLVAMVVHKVDINLLLLFIYIMLILISHIAIGLTITLHSKDFGGMLGYYMIYALLGVMPSIFYSIGIIPEKYSLIILISPSHSAQVLINSLFAPAELKVVLLAAGYLLVLGIFLYIKVVYKKYKLYAIGA